MGMESVIEETLTNAVNYFFSFIFMFVIALVILTIIIAPLIDLMLNRPLYGPETIKEGERIAAVSGERVEISMPHGSEVEIESDVHFILRTTMRGSMTAEMAKLWAMIMEALIGYEPSSSYEISLKVNESAYFHFPTYLQQGEVFNDTIVFDRNNTVLVHPLPLDTLDCGGVDALMGILKGG